ncbi:alginate biosynthesis protein AlgK [Pseudomonas sp. dw_358]|uniref:alginate biosynthesis protein AlgK n=1 Tax=Pseudomonas sp. dw_358 TaxID=2720083 RepID=UPI0031F6A7A3
MATLLARRLYPQATLGLAIALGLAACANLPDQRLANEALRRGDTRVALDNYQRMSALGYTDATVGIADIQVLSRDPDQIRLAEATYRANLDNSPRAQSRLGRLLVVKPHSTQAEREEADQLLNRSLLGNESSSVVSLAMLYLQYPASFPGVDVQQKINEWQRAGYLEAALAQIVLYRATNTYDQHLDDIEHTCRKLLNRLDVCYVELATVYQKRAQADQQAALLKQLQSDYALHKIPPERLDSVARVLADPDLGKPDLKTAEAMFEQVAPVYPASWVGLAQLLYDFPELGGVDQIMAYLEKGRAAAQPRANLLLGRLYYDGRLMTPNVPVALQYLEKAARTEVTAHYYIGQIYRRGYLGDPDPQKAIDHLLIAARDGQGGADFALAQLYATGHGIQPNLINAYVFAQLAKAQPDPLPQVTDLAAAIDQQLPLDKKAQAQQLLEREQHARGAQTDLQNLPEVAVGEDQAL